MAEFNLMQMVKRRMFAMRNGVVADALRRGGSPYRIIFGLNLPQLREIADDFKGDDNLAVELWHNETTRESRLLALLLMKGEPVDAAGLRVMIDEINDVETADMFVHTLLRGRDDCDALLDCLANSERSIERYMAIRLAYGLVDSEAGRPRALAIARGEIERADPMTLTAARQLEYDSDW